MSIFKTSYRVLPMLFTYKDGTGETLYMPQRRKWWWFKYKNISATAMKTKDQARGCCIVLSRLEKPFTVKTNA